MKKVIFLIIAFTLFFLVSIYMGWLGKSRHVEKCAKFTNGTRDYF